MNQLREDITKATHSLQFAESSLELAHEAASPIEKIVIGFVLSDTRHLLSQMSEIEAVICGDTNAVAT